MLMAATPYYAIGRLYTVIVTFDNYSFDVVLCAHAVHIPHPLLVPPQSPCNCKKACIVSRRAASLALCRVREGLSSADTE